MEMIREISKVKFSPILKKGGIRVTSYQRVYGKGRHDGFISGLIFVAAAFFIGFAIKATKSN